MAGGKIIRITGGKSTTECESWTVYCKNFYMSAGGTSTFTADGGTNFGEPKEAPSGKRFYEKGWWTDEKGNEIKEAFLGSRVQFHVKMQNIFPKEKWEYEKVQMVLREFDGYNIPLYILSLGTLKEKRYESIELIVKNELGQYDPFIEMQIPPSLHFYVELTLDKDYFGKFIIDDLDSEPNPEKDIELYFHCNYHSPYFGETESADLPIMEWDYLVVKPEPVVEPILFVEASSQHRLPAIYSAEDGSPWYVSTIEKVKETKEMIDDTKGVAENIENIVNYFKENGGGTYKPEEINKWSKRSYDVAIRKLKKGNLVFNDGSTGVTNRFHQYTVQEIDGRYSEEILMGVNRGKFKAGVTSKGINQLEAQAGKGLAKVFKTVGEINPLWDAVSDVADILVAAANHELPPIPFTPPFVTMEIDRMMEDYDETFIRHWNEELQKAILEGRKRLDFFLNDTSEFNKSRNLGFNLVNISSEIFIKILRKEFVEYDKSSSDFQSYLINKSEGKKEVSILIQSIDAQDSYNRETKNHYIHAIYLNDIKI